MTAVPFFIFPDPLLVLVLRYPSCSLFSSLSTSLPPVIPPALVLSPNSFPLSQLSLLSRPLHHNHPSSAEPYKEEPEKADKGPADPMLQVPNPVPASLSQGLHPADASDLPPTVMPRVLGNEDSFRMADMRDAASKLSPVPAGGTPPGPEGMSPGVQSPAANGGATPPPRSSTDKSARARSNALSLGLDDRQVQQLLDQSSQYTKLERADGEWLSSEGSNYVKMYRHLRTKSGLQRNSMDMMLNPARRAGYTPYRTVLGEIRQKLIWTRKHYEDLLAGKTPSDRPIYRSADEIIEPLMACHRSLWECSGGIVADGRLLDLLRRLHTFGLHLMKLDIRQESTRHTEVMDEITEYLGLGKYSSWTEEERCEFLAKELQGKRALIPPGMPMSDTVREDLATFRACAEFHESLGAYIISMAHYGSDVLAVELLQREARLMLAMERGQSPDTMKSLRVVPLFETLADLDRAPETMGRLLGLPWYRAHLATRFADHQEIMLGYSDSGKDAGRLAANWALYRAQEKVVQVCQEHGVYCTLFHGRGGSVGRGGAPVMQAVRSQPPGSVNGRLRVTEQGEMVQAKFGVPDVATRHLEVYTIATMSATLNPPEPPKETKWRDIMDRLSEWSCEAYRDVVFRNPVFISYFRHATPGEPSEPPPVTPATLSLASLSCGRPGFDLDRGRLPCQTHTH